MTDVARDMTVEAAPPLHRPGLTPPVLPAASLPQHVAVVMDGNGRWANARGLPRTEGHRVGEANMLDVAAGAIEIGVKELSVYAFSTENWRRSPGEVRFIMGFARKVLRVQRDVLNSWNVRLRWIGRTPRLWKSVLHELREAERVTAHNTGLVLNLCINYGGRAEIADATRAMLYETARYVDIYKALDDIARERKLTPEERKEQKRYAKLADAFTPMGKGMSTEFANRNTYDAIQVHGGSGFMKDYTCERLYRDARITNIYEGTTQLQVVAAIRHVTTGTYLARLREYEAETYRPELSDLHAQLREMTDTYEGLVARVTEPKDAELLDFMARRLVEAATHCVFGYLLLQSANTDDSFTPSARVYVRYGAAEIAQIRSFIEGFRPESLSDYKA